MNLNELVNIVIAWLQYYQTTQICGYVNGALIVLFFMHILDNRLVGGLLFEQKRSWLITAIAAVYIAIAYIIPLLSVSLIIFTLAVIGLVILTLCLKHWIK